MNKKGDQRKFVFWILVIATIIVLIVIIAMWLGYGQLTDRQGNVVEATIAKKILITFGGIVVLLLGYWFYNHQKKLDARQQHLNDQKSYGK